MAKKPTFTREIKRKSKILGYKPSQLGKARIKSMSVLDEAGIRQGVNGFREVARKINGMENAEESAVPMYRAKIPKCISDILSDDYQVEAMFLYLVLYEKFLPSQTVSLEPRMGGGDVVVDPYDEMATKAYIGASMAFKSYYKRRISKREAIKELEWLLMRPHNAVLSVDQRINAGLYAVKLKEVFGVG